jgi:hypothetical protein
MAGDPMNDELVAELYVAYRESAFKDSLYQRAAETIRALEQELAALRRDLPEPNA